MKIGNFHLGCRLQVADCRSLLRSVDRDLAKSSLFFKLDVIRRECR